MVYHTIIGHICVHTIVTSLFRSIPTNHRLNGICSIFNYNVWRIVTSGYDLATQGFNSITTMFYPHNQPLYLRYFENVDLDSTNALMNKCYKCFDE